MKKVLIIYPHWPPSNLTGVHRPRLIANFLKEFGWEPIVLTVRSQYYEEKPEPDLALAVHSGIKVETVRAFRITSPRIIGDIGLRSFPFLLKKARKIIRTQKIDFIWIPIPSFYVALIGRLLYEQTTVPYGIDYIDPWIRDISTRQDLRHKLSNLLAKFLEPIALKKVSLVSGVNLEYYRPVLQRNFKDSFDFNDLETNRISKNPNTGRPIVHIDMPYGYDLNDYNIQRKKSDLPGKIEGHKHFVYAGAFLPKSVKFLECLFRSYALIKDSGKMNMPIQFIFIGTGQYAYEGIEAVAKRCGISGSVTEFRHRMPYLDVLNALESADCVMIIGSTERHYTASKVFQSLLSGTPVMAMLHKNSSAARFMKEARADQLLVSYDPANDQSLQAETTAILQKCISSDVNWTPQMEALEPYSAANSSKLLAEAMNQVLSPTEER